MGHLEQFHGHDVHKTHSGGYETPQEFAGQKPSCEILVNGTACVGHEGELLLDLTNRLGPDIPQVCYHPQLGPIQTCDTCFVEVDGKLQRACATYISKDMKVITDSPSARAAQREAFDRILVNHNLYCTV